MQYVVLGLLILSPMTVYNINKSFEQGISLFYSASLGSLQTTLRGLLNNKLVDFKQEIENGRNKKTYHITPKGRKVFMTWMMEPIPLKNLEVNILSRIYFLGIIEAEETRRSIVHHMVESAEQMKLILHSTEEMVMGISVPDSYRHVFKYQTKTLDYGIQAHVFAIDWLNKILAEMN